MGLFDFVENVVSATVKVAMTPVAVVADVVSVATSEEPKATKKLIKSAGKDLKEAL